MAIDHEERLARNETLFRELNERINAVAGTLGGDDHAYEFVCECSDPHCTVRLTLTRSQYEHVRADPTRFVLARGHLTPEIEHVVDRENDHLVIEKVGVAADVAIKLDPRTV